jgi:branched-chain amino acid transport system permease protein
LLLFAQLILSGVLIGGLYALAALGLSLIFGVMRVLNVAHGAFYMVGAYVVWMLTAQAGVPFFPALLVTIVVVFVLGVIMERLIVRPIRHDEVSVLIVTFAAAFVIEELAKFIWSSRYRNISPYFSGTVNLGGLLVDLQRVFSFSVALAVIGLLLYVVSHTRLGLAMRMVTQDAEAALLMGINVERVQMVSFGAGAALAASAAGLLGPLYLVFPAMGWDPLLRAFAIVILGGMGSMGGTIFAGLIIGVVEVLTGFYVEPRMTTVATFLVLILILIFRPTGLFGEEVES